MYNLALVVVQKCAGGVTFCYILFTFALQTVTKVYLSEYVLLQMCKIFVTVDHNFVQRVLHLYYIAAQIVLQTSTKFKQHVYIYLQMYKFETTLSYN